MTLAEQLKSFDRYIEQAWQVCFEEFMEQREADMALARRRMVESYAQYGDRSWHKTPAELFQDRREEAADMLNYRVMELGPYCGTAK